MRDKKNIFPEEIELSEIVLSKTNHALEKIRQEDTDSMKRQNRNRGRKFFKKQAAAIACVCILAVSSISAVAAIRHYWGRGMNGNIQASDVLQQELTENGIAKVYSEDPDYQSLSVTNHGITITPDTVVADDRFAYMSFHISGYSVADGEEPGFDMVNVYQGENPEDWLNMSGTMYNGIVPDENGTSVYEDGSPLETNEDGSTVCRYTDSNGNMEFIIQASIADESDSLLGKTVHVSFRDLGTFSKGRFTLAAEGSWDFELVLPAVSPARDIEVGQKVEGTNFVMEDISISPVSIKVNYSVSEAPEIKEDDLGIPDVKGVVLKDGTKIPYLTGGGWMGYADSARTRACQIAGYNRVIDVDEVAALLVLIPNENEAVEIPVSK